MRISPAGQSRRRSNPPVGRVRRRVKAGRSENSNLSKLTFNGNVIFAMPPRHRPMPRPRWRPAIPALEKTRCGSTQLRPRHSVSYSTRCWATSAIPTCRALPTPPPTCWRRSSPKAPSWPRTSAAAQRVGDLEGCTRNGDGTVTTPMGFKVSVRPVPRGWLDGAVGSGRIWRAGPALCGAYRSGRISVLRQHGADDVSGPDAGRHRRHPRPWKRGAEAGLAAEDGGRHLDRHHEPDRAALRHRPRPAAHPRGAGGRRHLQDLRPEDIHLRRRARHGREYRASGAGPHRGRAGRHQGHFPVHRAQVPAGRGRRPGRAQRRVLRLAGREDGHPRQRHLRHELRRGRRLPAGRRERRAEGHVHHDERGPPRRRPSGPVDGRGGQPERRRLCEGAPAGPFAVGAEGARQAGRSDHRPPRHPPRSDDHARLQRGRPRTGAVDGAELRRGAPFGRRGRPAGGRRPSRPDDAGGEGRAHRQGLRACGDGPAGVRPATATSKSTA